MSIRLASAAQKVNRAPDLSALRNGASVTCGGSGWGGGGRVTGDRWPLLQPVVRRAGSASEMNDGYTAHPDLLQPDTRELSNRIWMVRAASTSDGSQRNHRKRFDPICPVGIDVAGASSLDTRYLAAGGYSSFSIESTSSSNSPCHSGAKRQSLSSCAPPRFRSCSAVGA